MSTVFVAFFPDPKQMLGQSSQAFNLSNWKYREECFEMRRNEFLNKIATRLGGPAAEQIIMADTQI